MKLLLDENVPASFIKHFKEAGYDVEHINKKCKGFSDEEFLSYGLKNKRIIITSASDFCNLRKREHNGIIKVSGKCNCPLEELLALLGKIKSEKQENVYHQIEKDKTYKETKVYSKKKHRFKHFRRILIETVKV